MSAWDIVFVDGPMAEGNEDRCVTGALADTLYYAPRPRHAPGDGPMRFMWVGDGHLPPEVAWDGQLKYVAVDAIDPRGGAVRFRLESEGPGGEG